MQKFTQQTPASIPARQWRSPMGWCWRQAQVTTYLKNTRLLKNWTRVENLYTRVLSTRTVTSQGMQPTCGNAISWAQPRLKMCFNASAIIRSLRQCGGSMEEAGTRTIGRTKNTQTKPCLIKC